MVKELKDYKIKPEKKLKMQSFFYMVMVLMERPIEIGKFGKKSPNTIFLSPNAPFECPWGGESFQWFELTSMLQKNWRRFKISRALFEFLY